MQKSAPSSSLEQKVGFDALPEQLVHRSSQSGFCFNLLCVGEPSIGKTTLIRSLFALPNNGEKSAPNVPLNGRVPQGDQLVSLREHRFDLIESGIKLRLRVIETADYGNQTDKRECYRPICEFIDAQFQKALDLELHVKSYCGQTLDPIPLDRDPCVHACLYFVIPTGHSIKAIDLITMKELATRTNLIPIIAKADALTNSELVEMKKNIKNDLKDIKLYQWPVDDEVVSASNKAMNERMPFAVVGSSGKVKLEGGGEAVRGRAYKWGTIQVR
ncbi:hypothetical protein ACOME3_006722 [Neoechinorhynchus agilis]